jgi:hypothetical protein
MRWVGGGIYKTRLLNPLAEQTDFNFDSTRRLLSLEIAAVSETTSFEWSGRRVTRITRPDGVQTSFVETVT